MKLTQVLIAIDQLCNTVCGGYADETLSARWFRLSVIHNPPSKFHGRLVAIVDKLFFWQPHHCMTAFEAEVARKQLPSIYQTSQEINIYATLLKFRDS